MDPFRVVRWAVDALDEVRHEGWREFALSADAVGRAVGEGAKLKDACWALWKTRRTSPSSSVLTWPTSL